MKSEGRILWSKNTWLLSDGKNYISHPDKNGLLNLYKTVRGRLSHVQTIDQTSLVGQFLTNAALTIKSKEDTIESMRSSIYELYEEWQ
jgi:hypothetical protein